jgi:hypothetical protein
MSFHDYICRFTITLLLGVTAAHSIASLIFILRFNSVFTMIFCSYRRYNFNQNEFQKLYPTTMPFAIEFCYSESYRITDSLWCSTTHSARYFCGRQILLQQSTGIFCGKYRLNPRFIHVLVWLKGWKYKHRYYTSIQNRYTTVDMF